MNSTPLSGGLGKQRRELVHDCENCASQGDTPLVLAFRLMGVHPDNQHTFRYGVPILGDHQIYNGETWFDRGWAAGDNAEAIGAPVNKTPFELETDDEEKVAWLVGYISGSMMSLNGWASVSCLYGNPARHLTNSLPLYMAEVERVGKFPVGCLGNSSFARGLMSVFMDNGRPFKEAADAITSELAAGRIIDLPTPSPSTKFDPNPTVRFVEGVGQYQPYIDRLDKEDPTWFWYEPFGRMAPELQKAATERRLRAIGEQGHLVPRVRLVTPEGKQTVAWELAKDKKYRVVYLLPGARSRREAVLVYEGREGLMNDEYYFSARPAAGTQRLNKAWIISATLVDESRPCYMDKIIRD